MKAATRANVRTSWAANVTEGQRKALRVSFFGGRGDGLLRSRRSGSWVSGCFYVVMAWGPGPICPASPR
jgi:Na+/H+-translocating membrane pyrophosphatase